MALRDLSDRDAILADLAADGEMMTADIIEKYKISSRIVNRALEGITKAAVDSVHIHELCKIGDDLIEANLATVFTLGQVEKGFAWPTCIAPNNICGAHSAMESDTTKVKEGDMLKITLGVQVDGYTVYGGHTVVVADSAGPAETLPPVTGRAGQVMAAARDAAILVHNMLKPDTTMEAFTSAIESVAKAYDCSPMYGVKCCSMKRFVPEGRKQFLLRSEEGVDAGKKRRPENDKFLADEAPPQKIVDGEVYNIKIMMSTGTGFDREGDIKTSVYQRNLQVSAGLRTKAGRATYSTIQKRFPTMPFSLRQVGDLRSLLGLTECVKSGHLIPFPPTFEKKKELVALYQFTAMVHNGKTVSLSVNPPQRSLVAEVGDLPASAKKVLDVSKGQHHAVSNWNTHQDLVNAFSGLSLETAIATRD